MINRWSLRAAAMIATAAALVTASNVGPPPAAHAAPMNGVVLPTNMCTALSVAFFNALPVVCQNAASMDNTQNLVPFANTVGNENDPAADAEDFKPLTSLIGSPPQLHEKDGDFIVMAFVDDPMPADIKVQNGVIKDQAGNLHGHEWFCGIAGGQQFGDDPDCIVGNPLANGVIVFEVVPDPKGERGPGMISVIQERVPLDLPFTVVGEAHDVKVSSLKTTVQTGTEGGVASGVLATMRPLNTETTDDDCIFPPGSSGFIAANGTAERTIATAKVTDSDGTAISGAFLVWQSSDTDIATTAAPLVPTLDTGPLGIAAPNILCGTKKPGTVKLTVTTTAVQHPGQPSTGFPVDPAAEAVPASMTVTVVGLPATGTIAADPATVPCDGVATSKVTATFLDAAGNPVADATSVHFTVDVLGSASPVVATTSKGAASTTVSSLARPGKGVPVTATADGTVSAALLVTCAGAAAAPTGTGPGAAVAGSQNAPGEAPSESGASAPTGVIRGPDTGFGPGASPDPGMAWWPFAALAAAAMVLATARFAVKRG